ncbi:unnamed protein product [Paramecium octaurelia]|uniref:Casein kinase I n=1 Tax=Paramecium octaurelia TaxID=43137 RepID=A0A8S1YA72_PAROT|nr:unnamed protein product [Paramecium octaurelia]
MFSLSQFGQRKIIFICLDDFQSKMKHHYESDEDDEELKVGDIIQGRFSISQKIGEGSFGQVYKVIDQKSGDQVMAMKVEVEEEDYSMLEKEIKVLIEMRKKTGFPQIKFYGQEKRFTYCIMTMLGKNLESVVRKCGGNFELGTSLKIAIQMIDRIETLHNCRFLHRDIKPDNFVLEAGPSPKLIYLIDFGLSKHYINSKGDHIQYIKKAGLIGTARYASISAHDEMEQGRKDDLESIGYVLIYLASGTLPWMNLQIEQKDLKYAKIHHMKKTIKPDVLCAKLPRCFTKFMQDVRGYEFKQQPNYQLLKSYFSEELEQIQKERKGQFQYDWEKLPEYQQKKKHLTVHIMQQSSKEEKVNLIKQKEPPRPIPQTFEQIMQDTKKKKSTKKTTSHKTKKKDPIMINIAEPDSPAQMPSFGILNLKPYQQQNSFLQIPQLNSSGLIDYLPSLNPSVATSKMNNYHQSEDVVSEGRLPIWELGDGQIPGFQKMIGYVTKGIKKPNADFQRKTRKAHTQIDTIKKMSQNLVQPKTIKGDDEGIPEGLD